VTGERPAHVGSVDPTTTAKCPYAVWLTVTINALLPLLFRCSSRRTCVTFREWFQNVSSSPSAAPRTQSPPTRTYPSKHANRHAEMSCVKSLKSTFPVSHVVHPKLASKLFTKRENGRHVVSQEKRLLFSRPADVNWCNHCPSYCVLRTVQGKHRV
jgi:hypothetical protein